MQQFRELLDRFTAAVEANDVDAFGALFTDDGEYDDVFYGVFKGRSAIGHMLREHFHGSAKDFRWEMHDAVSDGAIGYAHYTFSYTSTMKHSEGQRVVFTGCSQLTLADGRIRRYREWAFGIAGLYQLGAPAELLRRQAGRESERIRTDPGARAHLAPR